MTYIELLALAVVKYWLLIILLKYWNMWNNLSKHTPAIIFHSQIAKWNFCYLKNNFDKFFLKQSILELRSLITFVPFFTVNAWKNFSEIPHFQSSVKLVNKINLKGCPMEKIVAISFVVSRKSVREGSEMFDCTMVTRNENIWSLWFTL